MKRLILPRRALLKAGAAALITSPAIIGKAAAQLGGGLMFPGPGTPHSAGGGGSFTTLNPSDTTNGSLSGGNLIFTQTGATLHGGSRSISSKSAPFKVYFEATYTAGGADAGVGIAQGPTTPTFENLDTNVLNGAIVFQSGNLWINGSNARPGAIPPFTSGSVIGVAINIVSGGSFIWITSNGTSWSNGDPTTNTGGDSVGFSYPFFAAVLGHPGAGDVWNLNFGDSPFHWSTFAAALVAAGWASGWS